jgi:glycosyltransferase involved in cell wall biosynthesis
VVDELAINGAVSITIDLARRWAGRGTRLAVLHTTPGQPVSSPPEGVVLEHLTTGPARIRRALVVGFPRLVAVSVRCDVVVAGSEIGPALVMAFLAARMTRRPFVVAVHADVHQALEEWIPRRLHRLFLYVHRHVDGAICVAPGLVDAVVRNGLPVDRVRVVRNGIDTAAVRRAAAAGGNLAGGPLPTVVATGRLAPQKGYDLLIRAHASIVAEVPHRVLILNDGPDLAALQALAEELSVTGSVVFGGAVKGPLPTVAAADVFCLPSRHEGLPLALLEAIVLGVPVIAADCSEGVRAVLDDGRVGELVPVEDVDALAKALCSHLRDGSPLRLCAALGPAHARAFDSEAMASGWSAALDELASSARTRRGRQRRR